MGRDQGRCRECGEPGQEIDHIDGDSPELINLQLLCASCHHAKTQARMVPASTDQRRTIELLRRERVAPGEPLLLCDDRDQWATVERQLRKERRQRLLDELADLGYERSEFPGYSWADMWDEVLEDEASAYADAMDDGGWTPDDDTGYGPYSYFAHAMAKED
jgi:HNH endonuclease